MYIGDIDISLGMANSNNSLKYRDQTSENLAQDIISFEYNYI